MTSSSKLAEVLGSDCDPVPQHGECFAFSTACGLRLRDLCNRPGTDPFYPVLGVSPKAMKIWYADQGGMPADISGPALAGGVAASVVIFCFISWLANCWAKSYCGEPTCPSPLFKAKPSEPKASSASAAV